MLGVQIDKSGHTVVARLDSELVLIGSGPDLGELVGAAKARPGVDATSAIVAVPARWNDEQRTRCREWALAADIGNVRLINEPTAIALAYSHSVKTMPQRALILSVSNSGAFDVTVLAWREEHFETLAANGIAELDLEQISDADRLFEAIAPLVNRALKDASLQAQEVDAVVLGGASAILWPAAARVAETWGREPVEPPTPEIAIANGAAIYGRMSGQRKKPASTTEPGAPPKSGCLVMLAFGIVGVLALTRVG